jgi:hypothetical protein
VNRHLRRAFRGIERGAVCTGTVHALRLDSRVLLDRRIIALTEDGKDYVFSWRGAV